LYAQLLQDVAGALWKQTDLDAGRLPRDDIGSLPLRVVAVDPSVAENPRDECGIIVVGATSHKNPVRRHGYVLADRTVLGSPREWARAVVSAARDFDASVVAEANQGGALVVEVIRSIDPSIQVKTVHAKKGKKLRAEPVQMAYEQGRVSHLGNFPLLEAQMTSWVPGETAKSPDRVDALVYGLAALLIPSSGKVGFGQATITRAQGRIPGHHVSTMSNVRRLPLRRR
jgi:phage terminase large subunit-like protein